MSRLMAIQRSPWSVTALGSSRKEAFIYTALQKGAYRHLRRQGSHRLEFGNRPVRGGVAVQRDDSRGAVLPRGSGEEPFGGRDIALLAQEKIGSVASFRGRSAKVTGCP